MERSNSEREVESSDVYVFASRSLCSILVKNKKFPKVFINSFSFFPLLRFLHASLFSLALVLFSACVLWCVDGHSSFLGKGSGGICSVVKCVVPFSFNSYLLLFPSFLFHGYKKGKVVANFFFCVYVCGLFVIYFFKGSSFQNRFSMR